MSEFITVSQALEIIDISRPTLCAWCENGKLQAHKVDDKSKHGFHWEIEKNAVLGKQLEMSGTKQHEQIDAAIEARSENNDDDIEKRIDSLSLPQLESDRIKATLKSLTQKDAALILKAQQAFSKNKDNVEREGLYIAKEKVSQQIDQVFSAFGRSLKDLIAIWQKRYSLDEDNACCMLIDIEQVIKTTIASMQ